MVTFLYKKNILERDVKQYTLKEFYVRYQGISRLYVIKALIDLDPNQMQ